MSEPNEQLEQKKKRGPRPDGMLFTRSCRRTLAMTPEGSKDPWVDMLNFTLYEISRHPESSQSLRLQAIKTAIALCTGQPIDFTKLKRDEADSKATRDSLRPLSEEDAVKEAELDAQIADLQARLGSITVSDV